MTITDNPAEVFVVKWSPEGNMLAAGLGDGSIRVRHTHTQAHTPCSLPTWTGSMQCIPPPLRLSPPRGTCSHCCCAAGLQHGHWLHPPPEHGAQVCVPGHVTALSAHVNCLEDQERAALCQYVHTLVRCSPQATPVEVTSALPRLHTQTPMDRHSTGTLPLASCCIPSTLLQKETSCTALFRGVAALHLHLVHA